LPIGWSGSSDSASIIATSNGSGGTISVRAYNDSCGYSYATSRTIATNQPPGVDICLVTVDSASTHNIIIWEKPLSALIDSFFIYRETATNIYSKIASVPYAALSEYWDLDTNANPNSTSHRYKLSVLDTCGAESDLSFYHNTIHLQNLGNGNFQWTFYQIENLLNPVLSFNIYRDDLGNGNFFPIGNVPGTNATFTDINFNAFDSSIYVIDVNWSIACNPSRTVSTTRSNIRHRNSFDRPVLGMESMSDEKFEIFPNPGIGAFTMNSQLAVRQIAIINSLGQEVWSEKHGPMSYNLTWQIDAHLLPKGFYMIRMDTGMRWVVKKLVIE